MAIQRRYGWKRDLPGRYPQYAPLRGARRNFKLPDNVDFRKILRAFPVQDQGDTSSCTAHGITGALGFLELKELAGKSGPEQFDDGKFDPISRLFVYWNERAMEGDTDQDAGAQIADGVASLEHFGFCRESLWPWTPASTLFKAPGRAAYAEGARHRLRIGTKLDNTDEGQLLECLASGHPFVIGIEVFPSFESDAVAETGSVPMPGPGEASIGGHCMLCVGYDLANRSFLLRNSWGEEWGVQGYCTVNFEYLTSASLASDFWTLR